MARPGQPGYKGPVHETVRSLLGGWWPSSHTAPTTRVAPDRRTPEPVSYALQAKARMAVARSYHARSGTFYDPTTGSVSASGLKIGARNTGTLYSTARATPTRKPKKRPATYRAKRRR